MLLPLYGQNLGMLLSPCGAGGISSAPLTFTASGGQMGVALLFVIPAGVYSAATWTRTYTVTGNIYADSLSTSPSNSGVPWPVHSVSGTYTDSVSANFGQMGDINAAAGLTQLVTAYFNQDINGAHVESFTCMKLFLFSGGALMGGEVVGVQPHLGTGVGAAGMMVGIRN